MEERFGRLGRPITTALLAAIVIYFFLLAFETVKRVVLDPIITAIQIGYGRDMVYTLGIMVIQGLFILLSTWLMYKWRQRQIRKYAEQVKEQVKEELREDKNKILQMLNDIKSYIDHFKRKGELPPDPSWLKDE